MTEGKPLAQENSLLVAAVAIVEYSCALICASELLGIVSHFFTTTVWTCLPNQSIFLDIILGQSLYSGKL